MGIPAPGVGELGLGPISARLRELLDKAVKRHLADCLLLSGGLDTSILAALASRYTRLTGITVAAGGLHEDLHYARAVASRYGLRHIVVTPSEDEILEVVPVVVEAVGSFDPMEVNGSLACYLGLREAREAGFEAVMTGDGGDELFAGYTFLYGLGREELEAALRRIWSVMSFSSRPLSRRLGLEARLPYLDEEFSEYAKAIECGLKVRREGGRVFGKWILRKAFEDLLPPEVVWRPKLHIAAGSGVEAVIASMASRVSDEEFEDRRRRYMDLDGVKLRSKEGLLYYEHFRRVVGVPRSLGQGGKTCPGCQAKLPEASTYCRICGAHPL